MTIKLLQFVFFSAFTNLLISAWELFEQPIEIAKPNKDGIYEFDLLVKYSITMSSKKSRKVRTLVDYIPEDKTWRERSDNDSCVPGNSNNNSKSDISDLLQYDGLHRKVITINGRSPGSVIVVPLGAEVVMRVRNRLTDARSITLHLHGMDKRNAWWTDGVAFVQQCPIAPGSDHAYRFIADTPGTLWYHGHFMDDHAAGFLGGFVVLGSTESSENEAKKLPYTVGRDYYSILQDWSMPTAAEQWLCHRHGTNKWFAAGFDDPKTGKANPRCWAPKRTYDGSNIGGSVPLSAILVGEKGWYNQIDLRSRPSSLPLTSYRIRSDEIIRLRLVNGGISQALMIWVEDHDFVVVAADGMPISAKRVDSFVVIPGERYDVLIRGLRRPRRLVYRIIIETMEYINWDWTRDEKQVGLANLVYEDAVGRTESDEVDWNHRRCTEQRKCVVLNCPFAQFPPQFNYTCFSPHLLENAEPIHDTELITKRHFDSGYEEYFANLHSDNHMDGWIFEHPQGIPYYHEQNNLNRIAQWCDRSKCDHERNDVSIRWDENCFCFFHYNITLGNIVQMTIYNMGDMKNRGGFGYSHPFHLHSTHYYLLKTVYGNYHPNNGSVKGMNDDIPCTDDSKRCIGLNWTDPNWMMGNVPDMQIRPSFRDTVNIPVGGYIVIRFRATNPGWWFAHCHLILHHMGGTAFAFRVGSHEQVPVPPADYPHSCGIYEEY